MNFAKSLAVIDSDEFEESLFREVQSYISCLNVSPLTRCGGHASDPHLISVLEITHDENKLSVMVSIEFSDGDALDCSGHCGGNVVQRRDKLLITINRDNGKSRWSTADGVITGAP